MPAAFGGRWFPVTNASCLLPASALGGAAVLTLADLAARTVTVPREVPLGVMTALLGAPVFLVLLRRTRQTSGGFA